MIHIFDSRCTALPALILLIISLTFVDCAETKATNISDVMDISSSNDSKSIPIEQFKETGPVTVIVSSIHVEITIKPAMQRDCDQEHLECYRTCKNANPPWPMAQGTAAHSRYCATKCLAFYMECIGENAASYTFESMYEASQWLYKHPEAAQGAMIIVGTAIFVVITDGAGIVLAPYAQQAAEQLAR